MRIESIERFSGELTKVKAELESVAAGEDVLIACHNAAEVERLERSFLGHRARRRRSPALDRGPHPRRLPPDRLPHARDRRSRAFRPRRSSPPRHPPALRKPRHRQLPRLERGRSGRSRQPRDRPLPRPAFRRSVRPSMPKKRCFLNSPKGPSSMSRSPRSTSFRKYVGGGKGAPRSRRSALRPGKSARSASRWPSLTSLKS